MSTINQYYAKTYKIMHEEKNYNHMIYSLCNNLVAALQKCGIYPLYINQLLACLPEQDVETVVAAVDSTLITIQSEMQSDQPKRLKKSKRI